MSFKHVVLAVDLTEESILVANKAVEICKAFEADLTIIHVIESLNYAYGGDVPIDITDIQQQLQKCGSREDDSASRPIRYSGTRNSSNPRGHRE